MLKISLLELVSNHRIKLHTANRRDKIIYIHLYIYCPRFQQIQLNNYITIENFIQSYCKLSSWRRVRTRKKLDKIPGNLQKISWPCIHNLLLGHQSSVLETYKSVRKSEEMSDLDLYHKPLVCFRSPVQRRYYRREQDPLLRASDK